MNYSLGAIFNVPHGRAVGLLLPYTVQFNANDPDNQSRYREIAAFLGLPATSEQEGAQSLVHAINRLAQEIGQPRTIQDMLNISLGEFERSLDTLTEYAESDTQIVTSVRYASTTDVRNLFLYAFHGKNIDW